MKTILLIEDNETIRENTAEILMLAGYTVLTAENGKMGVSLALTTKPDLVVCDIMMPVLDGYGVRQIFNQNPQLTGVPFIFLTADTERTDLRRGMALEAGSYLTKPFEESELLSAVSGRLHRFQHLRPDYDLHADGLHEFLSDARVAANLESLTLDRKVHLVRKKQDVYLEGDEPTRLYFVKSGRVKTVKTTAAGKELITGLYGPGEFFGYLPLLEHASHSDSGVAVDDSELVYIPRDDFAQLLRNPEVGQQFIRLLAGRVSEREQQLLAMAYSSIRRRVADTLLRLHEQAGAAPDGSIQLSRDDMAAVVGTAPESLIRTLSEFKHDGLIELTPKNIRVLQPEKLRRAHW
ncbi:cAMP-binding domain of CRP or a regulatory subunit of cAMP-dependent protein kinases [Hymenobacter daecheongensis DSM 21074]|uniref:cAMP-binding domain of CRP or a regulatory subunit of cAMP-dependent protein kinases n=1 Tax=Hymenobacter daecheongensis DSM 21074 TaxID=1121955 RepID=A0A1M6G2X5_9BACT|nr:response regulator [Hymenobacter daecheongensis]SHJ04270.1 cAMP-binding domain of CRP or a regulatory subunit of cAMP-dependent protein kinases [Hymenobacter daecheongensis DSM 21074]